VTVAVGKPFRRSLVAFLLAAACVSLPARATADDRLADAVKQRDAAAVMSLIRSGVDVNVPESDGTTALHWAVQADDIQTAAALIKAGARVTVANRLGGPPLMIAATNGNATMIDALQKAVLLGHGASPRALTDVPNGYRFGSARTLSKS